MQIEPDGLQIRPCPICGGQTASLKQMRILSSVTAIPGAAVSSTVVYRSCPSCLRAYIWRRCLINGLFTLIVGYVVLVPYSLALTLATLRKGHSWAVLHGVTPEMEANGEGVFAPTKRQKRLAILSVFMCWVPVFGVVFSQWLLSETRWCSRGWVCEFTEFAALVSYFVTVASIGLAVKLLW
jgi:hypothetical protein